MKPLLSFIIPAWNEQDYIAATIESIQRSAKEYPHEIIVVNDNSDDESEKIRADELLQASFEYEMGALSLFEKAKSNPNADFGLYP